MKLKTVLITLSMVALCSSPVLSANYWDFNADINQRGQDKYFHWGLGAAGYYVTYALLPKDMNPILKSAISFVVPVALAGIKEEIVDKYANWTDVREYAEGAAAAGTIMFVWEYKW